MAQEIERTREDTINFAAGPAQLPYEVRLALAVSLLLCC